LALVCCFAVTVARLCGPTRLYRHHTHYATISRWNVPQGLKPTPLLALGGTAKAVPFPS
jgi:hypothetical protein